MQFLLHQIKFGLVSLVTPLLIQEQSHEKKMKSCWKKKYVLINPETLHVKDTSIQVEHLLVIHG